MFRALTVAFAVSATATITLVATNALAFSAPDQGVSAFIDAVTPVTHVAHFHGAKRFLGPTGSIGSERLGTPLVIPRSYDSLGSTQRGGWYNRGWGGTVGGPGWGYGFGPNLGGSGFSSPFR